MSNMKLSYPEKLKVISQFRRVGDVRKTSVETGYSASYVSQVFSGRYQNQDIVNYGFRITNGRKPRAGRSQK